MVDLASANPSPSHTSTLTHSCTHGVVAERQEYARRSHASQEVMREKMMEAQSMVDEEKITKKEISYGEYCVYM